MEHIADIVDGVISQSIPEYQTFGWSLLSRSSLPLADTYGLDYESARAATPRWYGVSSGNGNNGVSHMFPDYYVRTNDPWRLAELALVSQFTDEYQEQVADAMDVDGEADYTIFATLYDPLDDDEYQECQHCGHEIVERDGEWIDKNNMGECPKNGDDGHEPDEERESWSSVNGAYMIVEVFPVEADEVRNISYENVEDAFTKKQLEMIPSHVQK